MAGTRHFIKVFLASPGDLAEERKIAKSIVDEFNSQLADALGYQVELVGWEDTLPGAGRPQAIINRDLDGCDLFVGMLWKRWGTPPGREPYTSGFEEEFERSRSRNESEGRPEINLLLKDIDAASLADPGDHLKRVIAFKNRVFAERKVLAKSFADVRDFEIKFRRCIQGYVIALANRERTSESEKDQAPAAEIRTTSSIEPQPTTLLPIESVAFLREFLSKAEKATHEHPVPADEVARVRLLSIIAATHGNDEQFLGSHDANLLFKARLKFDLGKREIHRLVDDALVHVKNENVPLWYWIKAIGGFKGNTLITYSLIGATDSRVGALKAMRLIAEPIIEERDFGRKEIVLAWFNRSAESVVRVAALEYLGEYGQSSDLPIINREFDRNDTQTISAATDAIIRISLRDDRRAALEALYAMQPNTVKQDLLDALFSHDAEFGDEILMRGLGHRNDLVRTMVVRLLKKRGLLTPSVAESLLNDNDVEIRFEAMQALVANGRSYTVEQAKAILIRKSHTQPGLVSSLMSRMFLKSETAFLEQFVERHFNDLTVVQLEKESLLEIFNHHAYFALVRRDFKLRGDELRRNVANQFLDRFELLLARIVGSHGVESDLVKDIRSLGAHLRNVFTREGLDIICSRLDPADLLLVRSMLERGEIGYSAIDLQYLARFGQWCDIPLVIASLDRPIHSRKQMSAFSVFDRNADAAGTLYALGKHRLNELLVTPMPEGLRARIIPLISDKAFQGLDEAVVAQLVRSENENVRKLTSLKYVRSFPRRKLKQFLDEYMSGSHFYYNVIYWLDFGISIPRNRMILAAGKVLANA